MTEPSVYEIRASAFGGAFDCALRFEKTQFEGFSMPNSPRALIGTGTHAGTAAFDKAKLDGHAIRIDDAAGITVDAINERIALEGVAWHAGEPNQHQVESIALRLTTNYCAEISPRYEFQSVELTTKPLDIDCGGGIVIRLKGTLDRARAILVPTTSGGRKRRVADLKSGRAAVSVHQPSGELRAQTKKHRPQLGTYQLLDEHTTGEPGDDVAEIIGMNTSGNFATATTPVRGAKQLLLGTDEAPGLIELAAQMFRSGLFPPNPQSFLCSEKYCAFYSRCPYAEH